MVRLAVCRACDARGVERVGLATDANFSVPKGCAVKVGFDTVRVFVWQAALCPILIEGAWRDRGYVKTLRVFGLCVAVWAGRQ